MQTRRGFTIVEMVVTMAIMAILLTLTFVALQASQVNARDAKRLSDVQSLARGLEVRYKQGNPRATEVNGATKPGQYPGSNEVLHADGWDRDPAAWNPAQIIGGYRLDEFPGTSSSTFSAPTSGYGWALSCVWACQPAGTMAQITSALDKDNYVYEPIDANGNVCCCNGCVKFKIYYKREKDGTIQSVSSDHQ